MPDQTNQPTQQEERFESDTQKLVRRHLEDPNHVITEEEIKNLRVGMSPGIDAETEKAVKALEERVQENNGDDNTERPSTPWDVMNTGT
jgi:hypothetical protein